MTALPVIEANRAQRRSKNFGCATAHHGIIAAFLVSIRHENKWCQYD